MSDDSTNYSSSSDAVITSFVLGTFKTYTTVKSSTGADSVVTTSYTGSNYKVNIDQVNHIIYNTDSLPAGTKMKMLATVSSLNSGTIGYEKWTASRDSAAAWTTYSSSDSIDFADTLRFGVASTDGSSIMYYCVNIKKHTEYADSFMLHLVNTDQFRSSKVFKGIATSKYLYVLTDDKLYYTTDPASTWSSDNVTGNSLIAMGDTTYVYGTDGRIYVKDGNNAMQTRQPSGKSIKMLVGTCGKEMYAMSTTDSFAVSRDYGRTWTLDKMDKYSDAEMVPKSNTGYSIQTSKTNPNLLTITVIANDYDSCSVVWNKTIDKNGAEVDPWSLTETSESNSYALPKMADLSSCGYNKTWLIAMGRPDDGTDYAVYVSDLGDNGVTWFVRSNFVMPETLAKHSLLMSDYSGQYYYIMDPSNGDIYRGRVSNATWKDYRQTVKAKPAGNISLQ